MTAEAITADGAIYAAAGAVGIAALSILAKIAYGLITYWRTRRSVWRD